MPDAFEAACRASQAPRALYCNPTIQNPTTAIMPLERRLALAAIARRHGVAIIEDDPLGRLSLDAPPPIAALAPDVVWYVMGLTKCLFHGLRLAYLVGPSAPAIDHVINPVRRLSHWFPAPVMAAITAAWIERGAADEIATEILAESHARQRLAVEALQGADIESKPGAMHLWLRLPLGLDRRDFAAALDAQGVLVRPSDLFAVDTDSPPNAVRLSLSSPIDRLDVVHGLSIVAAQLGLGD